MPLLIRSALGAALLLSALPVLAETSPASGTATMANTEAMPLTYTSGPNTAVSANADNAAPCDDLVNPCDEFALTVNLPANFGSTNPNDQLVIRIEWTSMANDYDLVVYNAAGEEADTSGGTATTFEEVRLPAQAGINTYTIRTNFFAVADEAYTGLVFIATPDAGGGPGALPIAMPGTFDAPRFHVHRSPQGRGVRAAEPTLFKNWLSDNTMYIAVLETLRVSFDDSVSPAASTWSLHSPVNGVVQSLDPILWGDEITGRTLSSQLTGANSLLSFSDDDGESWTPAQIGPPNGGADHQSIGGGPYGPDTLPGFPTPLYPNAIYYCSQSIAAAFCARSDDGGLTFGAGVPLYPITQCFGLHGHVKVGPDGTVFVPNKSCLDETGVTLLMDGKPAVVVSSDSGVTWDVRTVPDAVGGGGVDDPSVAIANDGQTIYLAYIEEGTGKPHVAVSRDQGVTWESNQNIGAQAGVQHIAFPAIVAGDPDRALVLFLGTTQSGVYANPDFPGVWHAYASYTENGGKNWNTYRVSEDIVQRNGVCSGGACRNLLDFNDAVIDENGFLQLGYSDGCLGSCQLGTPNSFTSQALIARQSGGPSLFAAKDPVEPTAPKTMALKGYRTAQFVHLEWEAPDNGGSAIKSYNVYRSTNGGVAQMIGTGITKLSYDDVTANVASAAYSYQVTAVSAVGESAKSTALTLAVGDNLPVDESICTVPGRMALWDPENGDEADGPVTTPTTDVTSVFVAEPEDLPGVLAFTLNLPNGLATPEPNTQYTVRFGFEGGVHEVGNFYYARLDTTDAAAGERWLYGIIDPVGALVELGTLPEGLTSATTVTLFVPRDLVGNPPIGTKVSQIAFSVGIPNPTAGAPAGVPGAASPFLRDRGGYGEYVTYGNDFCAKGGIIPLPVVVAPPVVAPPAAPAPRDEGRFGTTALSWLLLLPLAMVALRRRRA